MNVELVEAGWVSVAPGILRRGEDLERPVRLPIPVYVLENGRERILVDTGPHPGAVADAERHYGRRAPLGPFGLGQERTLRELVDLATVTKVVLTHLHFDHAGGLAAVPATVPVYVQRREWEAGQDRAAVQRNFLQPLDYAGRERVVAVDGEHDLLGDGSVVLVPTPGHTPGHQSVRVGGVVIGGDVAPLLATLDDGRFPLFGDDLEAQAASAGRLRALRDREGVAVLPGHDPSVLRAGRVLEGERGLGPGRARVLGPGRAGPP